MSSAPRPDADEIFADAVETPADERADFVRAACAGDEALIAEVQRLLQADARAKATEDFLAAPPTEQRLYHALATPADPLLGTQIDDYQIVRRLGGGGFGNVYLATRTTGFQQKVAVKVLRSEFAVDGKVRARFELERQLLADLQHENIARLLSGGALDDGRPYIAMEYVKGEAITKYCDIGQLSIGERLALFRQACQAVAYAHSYSVIHRDIKPGNVMVNEGGQVKLLDFGIAKLLDPISQRRMATISRGGVPLTPEYASPEQVRGEIVTTASDVYSLGVVLYELLTGRPPYELRHLSWTEVVRIICEQEPQRPSAVVLTEERVRQDDDTMNIRSAETLAAPRGADPQRLHKQLKGDLEQIVLMSLRKEPKDRYQTVEALVADLDRFRDGKTVVARPVGSAERLRRWIRRRPAVAGLAAAAMLAAVVISGWGLREVLLGRQLRLQLSENLVKTAELHGRRGEWKDTLALLDRAQRLGSRDPIGLSIQRVRALESLNRAGDVERELEALAQRSDLGEHEAEVRLLQGMSILPKEGLDAAQPYFLQAHADENLSKSDRTLIEGLLAETSQSALAAFRQAVADDPYHHEARRFLVYVLTMAGRPEEAMREGHAAQLLFPDDPNFPFLLAYAAALSGDPEKVAAQLEASSLRQIDPQVVTHFGVALKLIAKYQEDVIDFWDFGRLAGAQRDYAHDPATQELLFDAAFVDDQLPPGPTFDEGGVDDLLAAVDLVLLTIDPGRDANIVKTPSHLIKTTAPRCFAIAYEPLAHLYSARTQGFLREARGSVERIDDLIDQLLTANRAHPESLLAYARGQLLYVRGRYAEAAAAFALAAKQASALGDYPTAALYAAARCEYDRHHDGVDGSLERAMEFARLRLDRTPLNAKHAAALYEIAIEGRDYVAARKLVDVLVAHGLLAGEAQLRRARIELADGNYMAALNLASPVSDNADNRAELLQIRRQCLEEMQSILDGNGADESAE